MIFSYPEVIMWLIDFRYLVIFPIVVVEGPIVTIICGFLAAQGNFNIFVLYGVIVLADLVADLIYYGIGRFGGEPFIKRYGHYIRLAPERLNTLEKHFASHGGKSVLFGKLSHGIGGAILVVAGIVKMPFKKFLWYSVAGTIPKSIILISIGYYFGQAYARISAYLDYTAVLTFLAAVIFIVIYFIMRRIGKKYDNTSTK